jgi:hypothetical protein
MEGDSQQQDQAASTDPKKGAKTTPTLQEQFDTLVNQKNALWDSIKGNYPDPYDDSFKQTDVYRKIEDIDKELFKIEGQMKGAV